MTLIAGTGYQYGDTDVIEYSERLYVEFTKELRAGDRRGLGWASVGARETKLSQLYPASSKGIHQKALLKTTLFGLPMMSVNMPGERLGVDNDPSIVSGTTPYKTNPGQTLGLSYADVTINPALTQKHIDAQRLDDQHLGSNDIL